ncbi:hypothetical protein [Paraburkholderia terrae]
MRHRELSNGETESNTEAEPERTKPEVRMRATDTPSPQAGDLSSNHRAIFMPAEESVRNIVHRALRLLIFTSQMMTVPSVSAPAVCLRAAHEKYALELSGMDVAADYSVRDPVTL